MYIGVRETHIAEKILTVIISLSKKKNIVLFN